jgi:hypothetical protein
MYKYGKSVGPVGAGWYQGRLRSDATKSILKELSVDLEVDENMRSEWEE